MCPTQQALVSCGVIMHRRADGSDTGGIFVHGGNSPSNERLGDMFMLSLA